jgi:hypothetical protein
MVIGAFIVVILAIWRFTSVLGGLADHATRSSERDTQQRERFTMQVIEKMQVAGDTQSAVRLAGMHGNESLHTHRANLSRDAVDEEGRAKVQAAREAEALTKLRQSGDGRQVGNEKDVFE